MKYKLFFLYIIIIRRIAYIFLYMTKRKTTEQFIIDARKVHGDKFDYSKAEYHGNKIPITIICPKHGEFQQIPNNHLHGKGCPKCKAETIGNLKRMSKEAFIAKAQKSHGNKYDYSKVDMENRDEQGRIYIICPIHGEFWQLPNDHMRGCGCDKCANVRKKNHRGVYCRSTKNTW